MALKQSYTFRIEVAKREGSYNVWTSPMKKTLKTSTLRAACEYVIKNAEAGIPTRLLVGKNITFRGLNYGKGKVTLSLSPGTLNTLLTEARRA